jgi:excisionase family DNA binding protein
MELLRPHEVAKILKLTPPSIRRLIRGGELPSVKIGGRLYIIKEELERKIRRNMTTKNK